MRKILIARMDPEKVADEIGNFIVKEIVDIGYVGGVIGLSGGVDSTTTAALTKRAFDKYNARYNPKIPLKVLGYMLPSHTNNPADLEDGLKVAKRLGIEYRIIDIEPVVNSYRTVIPNTFIKKFDKGNLMSEIRGMILRREAATEKMLVVGTGNRDEDFGVGYYTLFGDGAVHMSPIGNLPKRLVREMAAYLGFPDLANRVPTAGLEPGQTDFKDLGYQYEFVELLSEGIRQNFNKQELLNHPQVVEMGTFNLDLYNQKFGLKKFENIEDMIKDVFFRNHVANCKSDIVHPPAAEVSLIYEEVHNAI